MKLVKDIQAHIRGVVERGCAKMMLVLLIDLDKTTLFFYCFTEILMLCRRVLPLQSLKKYILIALMF